MSSRSTKAAIDLAKAEEYRRRRITEGVSFRSVRSALTWFWERKDPGPSSISTRADNGPNGEMVFLHVDGGRRADPHDVRATMLTIHIAVRDLAHSYPRAYAILKLSTEDGKSIRDITKIAGLAYGTVSAELWRGEAYLLGALREAGVVR